MVPRFADIKTVKAKGGAMEYTKFGDKLIRRQDVSYAWEDVPADDMVDAQVSIQVAEHLRATNEASGGAVFRVARAPRNIEIAARYGLTADQLAERLSKPEDNQGTSKRTTDKMFDADMAELGLTPADARARFNGTYWL